MNNHPNILFIMTDQHRYDAMGAVQSIVKTPNLDNLAYNGIRFDNGYCANPSCVPSRAAIVTGKWPSQCGSPTYITHLFDHERTFMSRLQDAGYHTAVIGKQNFGTSKIKRGYDYEQIINFPGPQDDIPSHCKDDSYQKFLYDKGYRKAEELMQPAQTPITYKWIAEPEVHVDSFTGKQGANWIHNSRPKDKPWYCCISFTGPHTPYNGLGLPQADYYQRQDIPLSVSSHKDWENKPPHWSKFPAFTRNPELKELLTDDKRRDDAIREMRHAYWANVSLIDEQIGGIIQALKETGEYDNTLIIFTSDHGDLQGEFSFPAKGQYLAESLMNVPFIIKPPIKDFSKKVVTDSFVSTIDIAPTILSSAQIEIPDELVGTDLSGWWDKGKDQPIQEEIYMEAQQLRGLRYGRWKFVYYKQRPYGELYDLSNDPYERYNLWDNPQYYDKREQLHNKLMDYMIDITPRSSIQWNYGNPDI